MATRAKKKVSGKGAAQNPNRDIIDILGRMAGIQRARGETYREQAYLGAIAALKDYPTRLKSGKEAQQLRGIGAGIASRIQEILKTGRLKELETAEESEEERARVLIGSIPGFGPKSARKLVKEGMLGIEDLRARAASHPEEFSTHQLIGLKYYEELLRRIPRNEVETMERLVQAEARKLEAGLGRLDPGYHVEAVGSYRRGAKSLGDIDMLLTHPIYTRQKMRQKEAGDLLENLVRHLHDVGLITDILALGPVSFMGVAILPKSMAGRRRPVHRRLDIHLFPTDCFACALMHFTGNGRFNREMRLAAKERGLRLNEFALRPVRREKKEPSGKVVVKLLKPLPVKTEEDIFRYLGRPYLPPEERNY